MLQISQNQMETKREGTTPNTMYVVYVNMRPDRIVSIECRSRVYFIVSLKGGAKR